MSDVVFVTVFLSPHWTAKCKFCQRFVTFRKTPDGTILKFDVDPVFTTTRVAAVLVDGRRVNKLVQDVPVSELHVPRCPGVKHSLFDDVREARV